MDDIKISIIIPIYNTGEKLRQCLDSIVNQTVTNFECILVNDGSSDISGDICNEYVNKDKRFKVIHKKNEGASKARNIGIEQAKGKWLTFIDSDDWVEKEFLENYLYDETSDIVFQGFIEEKSDTTNYRYAQPIANESFIKTIYKLEQLGVFGYTWNKLFRSQIIKMQKIYFPDNITIREDLIFTLNYCQYITKIAVSSKCLYHYIVHQDSLMFKKRNFEELYQCQSIVYKLRCNLEEKYKSEQYRNWFERENIDRFLTIVYNMYTPSDKPPRNKRIDILKTLNLDILAATKPTTKTNYILKFLFISHLPFYVIDKIILIFRQICNK